MTVNEQQTKELQAVSLEIFKEFIGICHKLNLKYYLLGGTMLGAVRHNGFIPWDDDIDVGMPRGDYEKFLALAQDLLPEHLFLQTYRTDPEYHQVFAKIRNSNTTFIENSISERKMNHGIFMDIFPLDIHDDKKVTSIMRLRKKIIALRVSYALKASQVSTKARLLRPFTKLIYPTIHSALKSKDKLYQSISEGDMLANYSGMWGEKEIVPAWWYGEGKELIFEGLTVSAPAEYEKWLTQVYGDYMQLPPVEKRFSHHDTQVIDILKSYREYTKKYRV